MRIDRLAQGGQSTPSATISTTPPGISRASAAPFIAQSLQQGINLGRQPGRFCYDARDEHR
jgi:hypothetical protein